MLIASQVVKYALCGAMLLASALAAAAADLTIHLNTTVSRHTAKFQCDDHAAALGLPAEPFVVEYLNSGANSLAVLPIHGESLIFAGVVSGSGARYSAREYVWWDAGSRGVHLYSDSIAGKEETACHAQR